MQILDGQIFLESLSSDPVSPPNGTFWYNSTLGKFRKREGGVTTDFDTTGGGGSAVLYTPGQGLTFTEKQNAWANLGMSHIGNLNGAGGMHYFSPTVSIPDFTVPISGPIGDEFSNPYQVVSINLGVLTSNVYGNISNGSDQAMLCKVQIVVGSAYSYNLLGVELKNIEDFLILSEDADIGTQLIYTNVGSSIASLPYKSYSGTLYQSGTDAPVVNVMNNDLSGTPVWTRTATDSYRCTLAGAFVENQTLIIPSIGTGFSQSEGVFNFYRVNNNYLDLYYGGNEANGILVDGPVNFEIRVYGTGGTGNVTVQEVEIDYGLTPVTSKEFVITDASVTNTKKITISPSPNPATDRVGNDWAVDHAFFSALAGTGNFTLYSNSQYAMVGKRKIYYQIT